MKFSHLADCHIGGWRDARIRKVSILAFSRAIDISVEKQVDFVLISGDLFNTSVPDINLLKNVVSKLKKLEKNDIPVYIIAGSHDFSPSGKTILEVLEEAGLCTNVVRGEVIEKKLRLKFTIDKKTGAKITGMLGKKGMLERSFYERLDLETLEKESGFKIFMFHSAITELKPKELEKMDSSPISFLPKGFNYYAGGHVHIVEKASIEGYNSIVYPGPTFPNNFSELEKLKMGSFFIYDNGDLQFIPLEIRPVFAISVSADNKTPEQVTHEVLEAIKGEDIKNHIVLIRVGGILASGKTSDVDFRKIFEKLYENHVYFIMRNTYGLKSKEFEEIKVSHSTIDEIEDSLIREHLGRYRPDSWDDRKEEEMAKQLMKILNSEKKDGERVYDYEDRMKEEVGKVFEG
ncbi:MAG: exonuclease SbcCD subunit D [Nanoarchaeota archaeon]|nr:exonuclease SbcCD subunit D [Nanoarchaeota archaeon]